MKKKIIALIAAAAVAASMSAGVFAAGTPDVQSGTEVYMSMSGSERTDFIDANLDIRLQHLSTLVTLTANRAYDEIKDAVALRLLRTALRRLRSRKRYITAAHTADIREQLMRLTQRMRRLRHSVKQYRMTAVLLRQKKRDTRTDLRYRERCSDRRSVR